MHKYSSNVFWSEGDARYVAICPEFPGLSGVADTSEQALKELHVALDLAIEVYQEDATALPEPIVQPAESGKVLVRMPKSMHRKLLQRAEREGVSLNTLIVATLAEGLGIATGIERVEQLFVGVVQSLQSSAFAAASAVLVQSGQALGRLEHGEFALTHQLVEAVAVTHQITNASSATTSAGVSGKSKKGGPH